MTSLLAAVVLAAPQPGEDDPASTGHGAEWGKAAPIGLLVILLLAVAVAFLLRSFTRQLKKVPPRFDSGTDTEVGSDPAHRVAAAPGGSGAARAAPDPRADPAADERDDGPAG